MSRQALQVSRSRLPPGPRPLPLIGSAHLIYPHPHRALAKIAKTYGPVITVYLGPHPTVIISDPAYNRKILANAPFLSRPEFDIRLRVFGLGFTSLATSPDNPAWRTYRKTVHGILTESAVARVGPALEEEVDALIARWTKNGNGTVELRRNFKLLTANGILATVYGVRYSDITDPEYEKVYFNHIEISRLAGISKATDVITQYIPGSEVSQLQVMTTELADYHRAQINKIKALLDAGKPAPDCFTTALLKQGEDASVETILRMTRDIVGGAFDTSSTSLEWLLAFVVNKPDVQRKLQEELDRVVGRDRAPTYDDQDKLIYLKAIIRETLRMRPPAPLGIPHAASEDGEVEVNGVKYLIPKGTMIMSNITALHEQMHPDSPDEFRPERHIDAISESESKLGYLSDNMLTFSTGRRICPGVSLAARTIFVAAARIIHKLEFSPVDGKGVSLDEEYGLTVAPHEFSLVVFSLCGFFVNPIPAYQLVLDNAEEFGKHEDKAVS
ncbi:cytochrome P450 [Cladochytrium replicatum]|nr:cytochrome P450 [Cladochytrium replicatum]